MDTSNEYNNRSLSINADVNIGSSLLETGPNQKRKLLVYGDLEVYGSSKTTEHIRKYSYKK